MESQCIFLCPQQPAPSCHGYPTLRSNLFDCCQDQSAIHQSLASAREERKSISASNHESEEREHVGRPKQKSGTSGCSTERTPKRSPPASEPNIFSGAPPERCGDMRPNKAPESLHKLSKQNSFVSASKKPNKHQTDEPSLTRGGKPCAATLQVCKRLPHGWFCPVREHQAVPPQPASGHRHPGHHCIAQIVHRLSAHRSGAMAHGLPYRRFSSPPTPQSAN